MEQKANEVAPKVETAVREVMPTQNDITRPRPETLCGKVWALADSLSNDKKSPVAISELLEHSEPAGFNTGNVKAEYARWRKFYNITGRVLSTKQVAEAAQKEADKVAKAEAAAKAKQDKIDAKAEKAAEREEAAKVKAEEKAKKAEERAKAKVEKERIAAEKKAAKAEAAAKKKAEAEAAKEQKAKEAAAKAENQTK